MKNKWEKINTSIFSLLNSLILFMLLLLTLIAPMSPPRLHPVLVATVVCHLKCYDFTKKTYSDVAGIQVLGMDAFLIYNGSGKYINPKISSRTVKFEIVLQ